MAALGHWSSCSRSREEARAAAGNQRRWWQQRRRLYAPRDSRRMWRLPGRPLRAPLCRVGRDWLADPSLGSAPWGSPRDLEPRPRPPRRRGARGRGDWRGGDLSPPTPTSGRVCCQQVAKALTGLPTPTLRLRLAGAPYPSCAKSARARPGKNLKTQKLRNPGGPGPYEIVAAFARTCLHVGGTCPSARGTPALMAEKSPQSLRLVWRVGLRQEDLGFWSGAEDSPTQPLPPTPG